MAYIVSYQKFITRDISVTLDAPDEATELCTIGDTTYVSVPDEFDLPKTQPKEIEKTVKTVALDTEIVEQLKACSPHVQLINERVKAKIAERYSVTDELKEIRNSSSKSFADYADYVEECRAWGREQKAALGLVDDASKQFRPLTRRQFKLVLMQNNLLADIEAAIAGIEDPALQAQIEIEYNEATGFDRTSDSVTYMSQLLGLNTEQVDALWAQALTL